MESSKVKNFVVISLTVLTFGAIFYKIFVLPDILIRNIPQTEIEESLDTIVYRINKTTVSILKGDIFNIKDFDARVFATKKDLGKPYCGSSIDGFFWKEKCLVTSVNAPCKTNYQILRDSIFKKSYKAEQGDTWIVKIPEEFNSSKPLYYLIAGIEAFDSTDTEELLIIKQKRIVEGIKDLCIKMVESGHTNIAVAMVGAGAGGLEFENSLKSILTGINSSAMQLKKNLEISLLLYPGHIYYKANSGKKFDKLAYQRKRSEWRKNLSILKTRINKNALLDFKYSEWSVYRRKLLALYIILLITAPLIAALLTGVIPRKLPNELTIGMILKKFVLPFSLVTVVTLIVAAFNIFLLSAMNLLIVYIITLGLTLWQWYLLGEPKSRIN